jgi:hypothetical protein
VRFSRPSLVVLGVFLAVALCSPCTAQNSGKTPTVTTTAAFVEKSRIEVSQNANGSMNFKNVGDGEGGLMVEMSLTGGNMRVTGFRTGTLVVAGGDRDVVIDTEVERAQFKIACKYTIQKGALIEIRDEGKLTPNLKYVREGIVVADFTGKDGTGKTVSSNKRTTVVRGGKVQSVSFEDATGPKALAAGGQRVDLQTMAFEVK